MTSKITNSHLAEEEAANVSALLGHMHEALARVQKLPKSKNTHRAAESLADAIGMAYDCLIALDLEWDSN